MKTEYEKKLNKLYAETYKKSVSAFDGLLDSKLLKNFSKLKNTGIRITESDNKPHIPFMHFYTDPDVSEKIFKKITEGMEYYRVWGKLYTQYEIDHMDDKEKKEWAQENLDKWNEYCAEMENVPEDEYIKKSDELLNGKYVKYTMLRNSALEALSFNYHLGCSPNPSYNGYLERKNDFLKLLNDNPQFTGIHTVNDVKKLCEKAGMKYYQDLGIAVLWYADIVNEHPLYKDEKSKLTYYKNY